MRICLISIDFFLSFIDVCYHWNELVFIAPVPVYYQTWQKPSEIWSKNPTTNCSNLFTKIYCLKLFTSLFIWSIKKQYQTNAHSPKALMQWRHYRQLQWTLTTVQLYATPASRAFQALISPMEVLPNLFGYCFHSHENLYSTNIAVFGE